MAAGHVSEYALFWINCTAVNQSDTRVYWSSIIKVQTV